jgi:hypothetical protein
MGTVTPVESASELAEPVTGDMVLRMLDWPDRIAVISVDEGGWLRVEAACDALAAGREAVAVPATAYQWRGGPVFTSEVAGEYAAYLNQLL